MIKPVMVASKCTSCGGDLVGSDPVCLDCPPVADVEPVAHPVDHTVEMNLVTDLPPEECAAGPLWVRIAASVVYGVIGLLCALGSLGFFMEQQLVLSDIVFGVMAVGLAVIAVFGVKESLFPSNWHPE